AGLTHGEHGCAAVWVEVIQRTDDGSRRPQTADARCGQVERRGPRDIAVANDQHLTCQQPLLSPTADLRKDELTTIALDLRFGEHALLVCAGYPAGDCVRFRKSRQPTHKFVLR